jgi:hypothetical protein
MLLRTRFVNLRPPHPQAVFHILSPPLHYLNMHPEAFQFVLYSEEDQNGENHEAVILTGTDGRQRLEALMKSVEE